MTKAPSLIGLERELGKPTFSPLYNASDPAAYATGVDESTFLADFQAASIVFATNSAHIGSCAHAFPAFIMEVRKTDPKIDAALTKKPALIAKLLQAEQLKAVFETRERAHRALSHS